MGTGRSFQFTYCANGTVIVNVLTITGAKSPYRHIVNLYTIGSVDTKGCYKPVLSSG